MFNKAALSFTLSLVLLSLFWVEAVWSQSGFTMQLRDAQSEVAPGSVAGNILKIVNNTPRAQTLTLSVLAPAGWQVPGNAQRNFTLNPSDSIFLPIRVIAHQGRQEAQQVAIYLNQGTRTISSLSWYVQTRLHSSWSARLTTQKQYFLPGQDTTSFWIRLTNSGDLTENLRMQLQPDPGLAIWNPITQLENQALAWNILLPAGKDTLFPIVVKKISPHDAEPFSRNQQETHSCRIVIKSATLAQTPKTWTGRIEFVQAQYMAQDQPASRDQIPLTLEWNTYDLLSDQAFSSLALYGNTVLPNEHHLNYYIQSSFSSPYLNPSSYFGEYFFASYQTPLWGVEAGNTGHNFEGASLSGQGIKLSGQYENHKLLASWMRSPRLLDPAIQEGFSTEYGYTDDTWRGRIFFMNRDNSFQQSLHRIVATSLSTSLIPRHHLHFTAGFSQEKHTSLTDSTFITPGWGYRAILNGGFNQLSYSVSHNFSSPAYLIYRGINILGSQATYRLTSHQQLGFQFQYYHYAPNLYFRGQEVEHSLRNQKISAKIRYLQHSGHSTFIISPGFYKQEGDYLNSQTTGADLEYLQSSIFRLRMNTSVFFGFTQLPESEDDPFFVAQWRSSWRFDPFTLNLRYFYGPYLINDLRMFAQSGRSTNRLLASLYWEQQYLNKRLSLSVNNNFNYATRNQQYSFSTRPELYYWAQPGLRLGTYLRYFLLGSSTEANPRVPGLQVGNDDFFAQSTEFGLNLRMDIPIAVSRKKYFSLEATIFRDNTSTGSYAPGDLLLENVLVRLQVLPTADENGIASKTQFYEALSDKRGNAVFKNLPTGNYLLSLIPLEHASFAAKSFEINLLSDQRMYFAIDRGARLNGSIIIQQDRYTQLQHLPLAGIRITASDSNGQRYATLTDSQGRFNLFLPPGKFTLSMDERILGNTLSLQKNHIELEVKNDREILTVNFVMIERGREIRIQTPNNNNSPPDRENE